MHNPPWMKKVLDRATESQSGYAEGVDECLRLVDREVAEVVVDRYGTCLWVSWLRGHPPTEGDLSSIGELAARVGCGHWLVNGMVNRGKDPGSAQRRQSPQFPGRWQAREDSMCFNLRADTGLSPGLFTDQRANRKLLRRLSKDAKVLNLFAYSCSFSLAAALGGASAVTSVDVSRRFLDWGKENFASNGLPTQGHIFTKADARDYLALARKRGWLFNYIVLDPPSFSRSKGKPFKVRNELIPMARNCMDLLLPGGEALVSTNLAAWNLEDLRRELQEALGCQVRPGESGPDITDPANGGKSFWLKKPG